MSIAGLRDTSGFVTNQRPQNWRQALMLFYPNGKAPLTALTSMMKSEQTDDPQYNWWDKTLTTRRLKLGANITTSTTSLTVVADGTTSPGALTFKAGDILYAEANGEQMRVVSDPTSDTVIEVSRGWASTSAAAITYNGTGVNPYLLCIGSAYEEASSSPKGVSLDPTQRTNYTQIFRNTLEMSNTAMQTRLRTGDQVAEAKRETLEMHSMDMERAFLLGAASQTTANGRVLRTTDGVLSAIASANIVSATTDYPSGVTMAALEAYFYNIFKFGSTEKIVFCGNRALLTVQQIIRKNTTFNIQTGIKEFGMNVNRLITPFGELVMKSHPLFNYSYDGDNPSATATGSTRYYGMESWFLVLDMEYIKYKYMKGRDTKYEPKLQDNDLDGMKSGYLTEASIMTAFPSTHYLIKNLATPAADA